MNFMLIPGSVFLVIEFVAYSKGEVQLATLATGGAFLCLGAIIGWRMWGRSNRKEGKDVKDR